MFIPTADTDVIEAELSYRDYMAFTWGEYEGRLKMTFTSLFLYAGNNKEYVVYVKDRDGVPIDLTGCVAKMSFRKTKDDPVLFTKSTTDPTQAIIVAPTEGEIRFYMRGPDTVSLAPRQYVWDIQVTSNSGKYTVSEGVLNLKQPVSV